MTRRRRTWLIVGGLASVFVGHRVFHDLGGARLVLSVGGALAVLAAAAWSARVRRGAPEETRRVEGLVALAHLGCALALAGFMVGTEDGVRWLGLGFGTPLDELRFRRGFLIGSTILLACALAPALAAAWASGAPGGEGRGAARIEGMRVLGVATRALDVALAGAFLMIAGYVTGAHDRTFDASYFKTATPGTSVRAIVGELGAPLRVLLFFPEVDPVGDEVADYARALEAATGNVIVERYDRLAQPTAAAEHDVTEDGTVILARGDRRERFGVPTDLAAARATLRVLDGIVQRALLELTRDRLIAYMTVGHGELNDSLRLRSAAAGQAPGLGALRALLTELSYEVRDLGVQTGLAEGVPADAATLLVLGPERPFLGAELRAVGEHLDAGGSLLLALEPGSDFSLGPLAASLGVEFRDVWLADDQRYVRRRGGPSDRRLIVTNRFAAHPSVTTATRGGVGSGIVLLGAGHLVEVEGADRAGLRFVIRSMSSTFADLDGSLQFDPPAESRGAYALAAAIERPATSGEWTMRALVYSDADMFSDAVLASLGMNTAIVADGIRWLGREEDIAGPVQSEADVPIVHTNAEDVVWFYAIILGAPGLVLGFGVLRLVGPRIGRRSSA